MHLSTTQQVVKELEAVLHLIDRYLSFMIVKADAFP